MIDDGVIKWVPYNREEKICARYSIDVWHRAVHDIDSDEEWASFLEDAIIVDCWVLKLYSNDKTIAFLYTKREDYKGKVFSVHGGGWENPLMYYRGYILMIKYLLDQGLSLIHI